MSVKHTKINRNNIPITLQWNIRFCIIFNEENYHANGINKVSRVTSNFTSSKPRLRTKKIIAKRKERSKKDQLSQQKFIVLFIFTDKTELRRTRVNSDALPKAEMLWVQVFSHYSWTERDFVDIVLV